MKTIRGFILLTLLVFSLFGLFVLPYEAYRTISARRWQPVQIQIEQNLIREVSNEFYPELKILDLESGHKSSRVSFRFGDFPLSLVIFSSLKYSSLYRDLEKYPAGTKLTAYRSPNGLEYVIEQNEPNLMLVLFFVSLIMPIFASYSFVRSLKLQAPPVLK